MYITGKCHCGNIKLEATAKSDKAIVCHCTDCQLFSGAPYRAVVVCEGEMLEFTGTPAEYTKTADSGNKRIQGFCSNCGTQLYATDPKRLIYNVRVGWLEQRYELHPSKHMFAASSQAWIKDLEKAEWHSRGL